MVRTLAHRDIECIVVLNTSHYMHAAFSFVGVVLIARPDFLFGRHSADGLDNETASGRIVTPGQRLGAVGYDHLGAGLATPRAHRQSAVSPFLVS